MTDVCIIMGSKSDLSVAEKAVKYLDKLAIEYDIHVASAHRTPDLVERIVTGSDASVFIAIAGLSAALPGTVASLTHRPVIGVPVSGKMTLDSLLSVVQMPPGVPVGAVGLDRGDNAAILAARILSISDDKVKDRLDGMMGEMREKVMADDAEVSKRG